MTQSCGKLSLVMTSCFHRHLCSQKRHSLLVCLYKILICKLSVAFFVIGTNGDRSSFLMPRLRESGLLLRFISNTTKESKRLLLDRLRRIGFNIKQEEVFTCLSATRRLIERKGLRPMLLLDEAAMEEFEV